MRLATIGKQFVFHAAHRLPNHDGLCKDLHGHSYKMEVLVTKPVVPPDVHSPMPNEGMVLDFQVIKDIYREHIEPLVEHKFLNETLTGLVPNVWDVTNDELCPLTTCESVALWMWNVYDGFLTGEALLVHPSDFVRIRLWETPTSFACVPAERNGVETT